jgi:phosphoribosylformimino-5-aminoimidazole carboxamide ribotide isomerase
LHQQYPQLAIYAGGGLRNLDDLQNLADAGCEAALVSSALHDGWITRQDMAQFSELDESA